MIPCSQCGAVWDEEGYYHRTNGDLAQPCKVCCSDAKSIYYVNNLETIREKQREAYYRDLDRKREYYRKYRRMQRAQATV
jgi:hypothetical protein